MFENLEAAAVPKPVSSFGAQSTALEVAAGIDLTGKTVIVTGGASGIGIETVRALAIAGANVTIAARNLETGREVAQQINSEIEAVRVDVDHLDLGSLASVRAFAQRWGDRPLNILINNAGIMACPLGQTEDGFELQFGTNHLGHFLLTNLLTPSLKRGVPARVVVLSSSAHRRGTVDFDDPNFRTRPYHPFKSYGQSKTANALFALEYDRRYKEEGIRAFSLMPGVIATPLLRHMTPELHAEVGGGDAKEEGKPAVVLEYKTPEQGAATTIWAAISPDLDGFGGLYLEDCNVAETITDPNTAGRGVMAHALDPDAAKQLWTLSEESVAV